MWKLTMHDAHDNKVQFWCKSLDAALERVRRYVADVGGVAEVHIQSTWGGQTDDRKGA